MRRDYFETRRVDDTVELDGHVMTFRGWTYSLEHYALALEQAGLRIAVMREPRPAEGADKFARWRGTPMFLNFRAVKP